MKAATATARTLAAGLPQAAPGSRVRIEGWIHRRRFLAAVTFLIVRDRTGLAQVIIRQDEPQALAAARDYGEETVVAVTGVATQNPAAPGGMELTEPRITALTEPAHTPPVELWRPTLDAALPTLLDHAAVSWRHPARRAAWQIAAASLRGFRSALDGLGFTEIQTPKLVPSATESGANVFGVDYFGDRAYLAQSPQFYKQTMVGVFERVYETGPVFRAEPHDTARHLAEYVSLDAELGFISDHRDVLAVLRHALAGMTAAVREQAAPAAERLGLPSPRSRPSSRSSTSVTRWTWPARRRTSRTWPPRTSRPSASGRPASTAATSSPSRATRCASARSTPTRSPATSAGRTASTCCSAAWNWSPAGSGCTATRLPGRHPGPRRGPGRLRRLPGLFRARHAAARRLRARPGALDQPAGRRGQRAGGHPVPQRPAPPNAVAPVRAVSRRAVRRAARGRPGRPRR